MFVFVVVAFPRERKGIPLTNTALMQDFTGVWGGAEKGGGGGAGCTEYSNTRGLDHCCGCNI